MKSFFLALIFSTLTFVGGAFAQEFRTTPRVAPQVEPARPAVEQNSNSDMVRKFQYAPNKLQLLSPLAPRRYGSGEQVVAADPNDARERGRFWRLFSLTF